MATTQLEVLALWTRARREADAEARRTYLNEAEQLTAAEHDPREHQFAARVLQQFQRWMARWPSGATSPTALTPPAAGRDRSDTGRYRLAPAEWPGRR